MGCHLEKFDFRSNNIANTFLSFAAGVDLRVCPKDSGKQCCSQRMEDRFAVLASGDFDKAVSSKVGEVRALFNEQAKTFDGELILDKMYKVLKECGLSLPAKNLLMDFHLECAEASEMTTLSFSSSFHRKPCACVESISTRLQTG